MSELAKCVWLGVIRAVMRVLYRQSSQGMNIVRERGAVGVRMGGTQTVSKKEGVSPQAQLANVV